MCVPEREDDQCLSLRGCFALLGAPKISKRASSPRGFATPNFPRVTAVYLHGDKNETNVNFNTPRCNVDAHTRVAASRLTWLILFSLWAHCILLSIGSTLPAHWLTCKRASERVSGSRLHNYERILCNDEIFQALQHVRFLLLP